MKLIALFSAAALAAGTLMTAAPAEAQRYGYDRGYDRGYDHRGYDRRDDRGWRGGPRYHGRGFDRDRGYGYGGGAMAAVTDGAMVAAGSSAGCIAVITGRSGAVSPSIADRTAAGGAIRRP